MNINIKSVSIIIDEVSKQGWRPAGVYAVKNDEWIKLPSSSAHDAIEYVSKGYIIETVRPLEITSLGGRQ